jgi:rubrerythrin
MSKNHNPDQHRGDLISLLQLAYSGERAAGYAYRGHWHSVSDADERSRIESIENEEWRHRRLVGDILRELGAGPNGWREVKSLVIGRVLGVLCHLSGWMAPMYGAGKLESRNIREYETAARHAWLCGRTEFVECLLAMAEVEWEHEHYFRNRVLSRRVGRFLPMWPAPPPKENIRTSFSAFVESAERSRQNCASRPDSRPSLRSA